MTHAFTVRHVMSGLGRFLEHAMTVFIGFVMMVVGLGMGVTMVLLPVGIVIGLIGVALVVGGLFARIDRPRN